MESKGWHSRGYLPHSDFAHSIQAVTFRLADSLPAQTLARWKAKLAGKLHSPDEATRISAQLKIFRRIASFEDTGYGCCLLGDPRYATIVQEKLLGAHDRDYELLEWCVMPNHVHVLIHTKPDGSLSGIVKKWKGGSAIEINRLRQSHGTIWMPDYHDRYIRNEDHFQRTREYIRHNPVKARLCRQPEDWPFSSAFPPIQAD